MRVKKNGQSEAMELLEKLTGGPLTIGNMLEAHRKGEEKTLANFAAELGISRQHLCDVEKGRRLVSPARAARYAKKLGMHEAQWIRIAIQDQLRQAGLKYKVSVEAA